MDKETPNVQPGPEAQSGNMGEPSLASLAERAQGLVKQMEALIQSGGDPNEIKELRKQWNAVRLRMINRVLSRDDEQDYIRVIELGREAMDMVMRIAAALDRPDLTFPELLSLQKLFSVCNGLASECLEDEKLWLEPKPQRSKRRQRAGGQVADQ